MKKSPAQEPMLAAPIRPLILQNALPGMAAMLACALCTFLDGALLARRSAQDASCAALSYPLLLLIQTVGFTLGMGAGSHVSRTLAQDKESADRCASTALCLAALLSLLLCGAGFFLARPLLSLLGGGEAPPPQAVRYARFVLACGAPLCVNLTLGSLLRAQGLARANAAAFLAGAALSLPLQWVLIPRFGVTGSGAAMLVRELAALALLLPALFRGGALRPRLRLFSLRRAVLADIMRSGLPTLLRQGTTAVSSALLMRVSASFGEAALGGMGLCARSCALVLCGVIGFGQGFAPVCGFAFGAGDLPRMQEAYRFSLRCVCAPLALLGAAGFVLAPRLTAFAAAENSAAAAFAAAALRAQCVVFPAQGVLILMNMLTQAAGMTLRAGVIATSRQGFVLIPLLLILPRVFGAAGLILCQSASDLLSLALCIPIARSALKTPFTRSSCGRYGCSDARTASR